MMKGFLAAVLVLAVFFLAQVHADARLFVVHGVSDVAGDTTVNVNINGSRTIDQLTYQSGAGYVNLAAGPYNVEVFLASNNARIINKDVTLEDGKSYVAVAVGPASDPAQIDLFAAEVDVSVTAGKTKAAVFHVAFGGPAVDVYAENTTAVVSNLAYPGASVVRPSSSSSSS